jgi:streptogramin lyase
MGGSGHDHIRDGSGVPRRFDVGSDGIVWIPAYSGNALVRLDPRTGTMSSFALPAPDCLPYVARVSPSTGHVWIGTGAADAVMRFDPRSKTFDVFPLPTRGATVRHMAIDPETDDVWLAYGASPAVHPARIARVTLAR